MLEPAVGAALQEDGFLGAIEREISNFDAQLRPQARTRRSVPPAVAVPDRPADEDAWGQLSDSMRDVYAWAAASEPGGAVGTRGLLIGIIRAQGEDSEPEQLLKHLGLQSQELFEALQRVQPQPRIDPSVSLPTELTAFPSLTPNARRALNVAYQLQQSATPNASLEVRHLFGGLLNAEESRAYQALELVLRPSVPIAGIRDSYPEYLGSSGTQPYADFLQANFPVGQGEIGTLGGAGNDAVGDEDQLGFQHYVDAFADLITSPHATPPLTIGIFGSWGMGKSFLLRNIANEIQRRQPEQKRTHEGERLAVHVVDFNAWEFSATEHVWPRLVRNIIDTLDEALPSSPWRKRWDRLKWNLSRKVRQLWVPLLAAALAAAVAFGAAIWRDNGDLAAAIVAGVGVLGVSSVTWAAFTPIARWVTSLFADPDYGRQIDYMADIKHELEELEPRLHKDGNPDAEVVGRILILIDDLDRCEPEKAVEMLQAVNLLLGFRSFIVCLGIDARIVTGAVEKHYAGLLGRAGASGYEYLDKIVQIPFRIPEPSPEEVETFIEKQLPLGSSADIGERPDGERPYDAERETPETSTGVAPEAPEDPQAEAFPARGDEEDQPLTPPPEPEAEVPFTRAELRAFGQLVPFLRPNPRHLKRLVNVYRLVRALARAKREELILGNPNATIRWLVMWAQWPYTAHAMFERFETLRGEWSDEFASNAPQGDPLLHLLDGVEPGLNREIRARLDYEPGTLRGLLAVRDGSLSWDELRRIRKYTVNFNPAVEEQLRASTTEAGERGAATVPAGAKSRTLTQPSEGRSSERPEVSPRGTS